MVDRAAVDQEKVPLTQGRLKEIREEYQKLLDEKRPQLVQRLAESRKSGDLTEDNEYTQAKQELAFVDEKISELEDVLARSVLIDDGHDGCQEVKLGCRVTLFKTGKQEEIFHLVGEWEADPIEKKISHQSPLGKALLGRKVGDEVQVDAPVGKVAYVITQID